MVPVKSKKEESPHIGSDFDDFLKEEDVYDEICANIEERLANKKRNALILIEGKDEDLDISDEEHRRILESKMPSLEKTAHTAERADRLIDQYALKIGTDEDKLKACRDAGILDENNKLAGIYKEAAENEDK